ncbi:probable protein S-acyltransferase 16 isoform X2 [Mangifera indica]|uniref:probable protein S-acyltransferase 16 isoform X2 n=1 Tax=Mangifera indica TaxID=29780 RepID=UPI001CF9948B|nr:probable protein S-acyltransferase 16 isoform X2 [Mangifera indica]
MTMKQGFTFSLPVIVVVFVISYVYFTTVFIFIDQWFGLMSSPGIMNAVVFTAVALMCMVNYSVAIFRDPGWVPANYMPDIEDDQNTIHEIKRKGGDLRYCQKCSHYKPPRSHHCRVCKRCVLLMVLLVGSLSTDPLKDEPQRGGSYRTAYVISGLLLVPLSVALSVLLGWHIYLILQNKTTIEYHEGVRALWLAEKGGHVYKHPYDLGVYENLTTVLGPSIFSWVCPTSRHIGSGLQFRTAYDNTAGAASVLK